MELRERLRRARQAAGMSQNALAECAGIAQSSIAAYESGARTPSERQARRVLSAAAMRPSDLLERHRDELRRLLAAHGVDDARIFGSVARGEDQPWSDLDLLIELPAGMGIIGLARLAAEIEDLLGVDVDVVTLGSLEPELFESHRGLLSGAVPA